MHQLSDQSSKKKRHQLIELLGYSAGVLSRDFGGLVWNVTGIYKIFVSFDKSKNYCFPTNVS